MEEQEQEYTGAQEQRYIKGFNHGYLLAKHEPELLTKITVRPNEQSDYFNGLVGGKEEYEKEVREWAKGFSRGAPKNEDRGLDKAR